MKFVIFGGTGGTGRALIDQALRDGHDVTAVVRRPEAIALRHDRLHVFRGDVLRPETLDEPVAGREAVLSALGIGLSRAGTTVYSAGTRNILAAMRNAGLRRILVVSTASLELPPPTQFAQWLVYRGLLHPLLRRPYGDMRRMEAEVRSSGLDWTLVRAARLTNGRRPGAGYRTAVDGKLRGGWSISRADVAGYMLSRVDDPGTFRATVEIAY
jgi:putative NADH-flavin reductase